MKIKLGNRLEVLMKDSGINSAEIYATQNLYTTLGYYHPAPLDAANEANAPLDLFSSFLMMRLTEMKIQAGQSPGSPDETQA